MSVLLAAAALPVLLLAGLALLLVRPDLPPAAVEARRTRPDSRFVEVDGLRMHCLDTGQGPAIVLVHGIAASHVSFLGWVRELSRDHRVIALDLPGHGLTGPDPAGRYGWAEMAERVHGLAEALGLDRFVIAGNSLGGAVSLAYALAHPEKLRALVLIDAIGSPLMRRSAHPPRPLAAMAHPRLGRFLALLTPRFVVRGALASTYGDPKRLDDATAGAYAELLRRAGNRRAIQRILLRGIGQGLAERIGELEVPTLVLWGGRDSWVAPKNGDWFAGHIAGAKLVSFPELGHLPMSEDPGATAAALREFLRDVGER